MLTTALETRKVSEGLVEFISNNSNLDNAKIWWHLLAAALIPLLNFQQTIITIVTGKKNGKIVKNTVKKVVPYGKGDKIVFGYGFSGE